MAIDAIAGLAANGVAPSLEAIEPVSRTAAPPQYSGTSDAAKSSAPYQGDIHEALQAQVNDLIKAEQRQRAQGGLGEQHSGVSASTAAPVTSIKEALGQVRTMFEFGVKATLLGSVANQSVSAVTTLAKSQ